MFFINSIHINIENALIIKNFRWGNHNGGGLKTMRQNLLPFNLFVQRKFVVLLEV